MTAPLEEMQALVGFEFPGGSVRIEHWENFLLTEATGSDPLPDALAHPIHLFHVPLAGAGVSIADLFALARSDGNASVTIDYYDWEYLQPLREEVEYRMHGGISEHERTENEAGTIVDSFTFRIEMADEAGDSVARVAFRWHFWRLAA
jgi:hypothetical protein